ncbi:MAG: two-component system, OmpR family, operon response regulator KdpE, partial [Actinomycetota bacterium]|nr:two-component system, OmpR family, operon response regulator KdpE [Actinomycetota bacterium]
YYVTLHSKAEDDHGLEVPIGPGEFHTFAVSWDARNVVWFVDGREVELTPKEFGFLALLARHPGRVLTHRTILQEVWGPEYGTESQYLRVYASQIRKKIADDPASPRLVTAPGVGYRLVDSAESNAEPT